MKLRNKKTGEIREFHEIFLTKIVKETNTAKSEYVERRYPTIVELINADWEDYTPSEPLIKDEKIRKAVRAWWEAIPDAITDKRVLYKKNQDLAVGVYTIYCGAIYPETLETGKFYTIAELCGEEEE
jgi:hypothetical protein